MLPVRFKRMGIVVLALCLLGMLLAAQRTAERIPKLHWLRADRLSVTLAQTVELPQGVLPVYRMKTIDAAAERQKISQIFDISPSEIGNFPNGNILDNKASVGLDAQTGRWFYQEALDWDAAGADVLSDAEAIERARAFIAQNELYPIEDLGQGKIGETYTGSELEGNKQTLRKTVYFYPSVDGKDVYGNFRICITFSPEGDIIGVDKFASEYELVSRVTPKNKAAVERAAFEGNYTLASESAPETAVINAVSCAFYADPESAYLQPIYVLEDQGAACSLWMDAAAE